MRRSIWFFGLLVLVVAAGHFRSYAKATPTDFRAFYCAGRVVLEHGDPYRAEPLFTCERTIARAEGGALLTPTPVPLPSYDFIPLAVLASMPVKAARFVYVILILAALAVLALRLSRIGAIPIPIAFAIAFFGIVYEAVGFGQIAPIAIAAVSLSVVSLVENKPRAAALWLGLAMIQPQGALAAFVALIIYAKGSRWTAAAVATVLGVLAYLGDGIGGLREYPQVVALQAHAEAAAQTQYSLTWFLQALGVDVRWALEAGALSYVVLGVGAIALLYRNRVEAVSTGAVIIVPALLAVFGGTYVHAYQLEIGVVAAVLVASRSPIDLWLAVAIGSLVLPFAPLNDVLGLSSLPAAALAVATTWLAIYVLSRDRMRRSIAVRATYATAIVSMYFAACAIARHYIVVPVVAARTIAYAPDALASLEYLRYAATLPASSASTTMFLVLVKLPLWFGLGVVVGKWLGLVRRGNRGVLSVTT